MSFNSGNAVDWTNGTGVFPAGGVVNIPANTERQFFYVENRDVSSITVQYTVSYANGSSGLSSPVTLAPGAAAGKQGAAEERDVLGFMPEGAIVITGTAGQQVTILTG